MQLQCGIVTGRYRLEKSNRFQTQHKHNKREMGRMNIKTADMWVI